MTSALGRFLPHKNAYRYAGNAAVMLPCGLAERADAVMDIPCTAHLHIPIRGPAPATSDCVASAPLPIRDGRDGCEGRAQVRVLQSTCNAARGGVHFLRVSKHFNCIWPTMKRSSCRQGWGLGVGTGFGGNYFTYRNFSLNYRKLFQNFSFTYRNYLRMRTKVCEYRFLWFLPGSYCSTHSTHHLR